MRAAFSPADALRAITRSTPPSALVHAAGAALLLHGLAVAVLWAAPVPKAPRAAPKPPVRVTLQQAPAAPAPPAATLAEAPAPKPAAPDHKAPRPPAAAAPTPAARAKSAAVAAPSNVDRAGLAESHGPMLDLGGDLVLGDAAPDQGFGTGPAHAGAATAGGTPPRARADDFRCDWPSGIHSVREATVEAIADVLPTGRVQRVTIKRAPSPAFEREAVRCVKATRFEPARDPQGAARAATSPLIRLRFAAP